jgi:hypothetical protein
MTPAAIPAPTVVVRHHGDSWTVVVSFGDDEVLGIIYDAEMDPRLADAPEARDPVVVVWDTNGDAVGESLSLADRLNQDHGPMS